MSFKVRGIPQALADEVRRTRVSPGYGHPVHEEIASGTGPCRCCLRPFEPQRDRRLLFTYRPAGDESSLMAPGPVFIHADHCDAYSGDGFPPALRSVAIAFEARGAGSRVSQLTTDPGVSAEAQIGRLFGHSENDWLHVRHAQAGCFIARVDRSQGSGPISRPGNEA